MTAHVGVNAAGEHQHSAGVHIGLGDAAGSVDGAGANGGGYGQRLPGDAVVGISQVHRALLVHHREGFDLLLPLHQRVE